MYRNVILDFLSTKRKQLNETSYLQVTFCQLGTKYDNMLTKLLNKEDLVKVYHVNEPRIYEKEYSFDYLVNSIVMMTIELKQEVCFNFESLNFELKDPYYLKDLRNINFKSLQALPVFEQDEVCGVVIVYFNEENQKVAFTNQELLKLFTNLNLDIEKGNQDRLENLITKYDDYYIVAMNKDYFYLNNLTKEALKIKDNILVRSETSYIGRIMAFINQIGFNKTNYDNLNIYYLDKNLTTSVSQETKILSMYNIDKITRNNELSLIMVRLYDQSLLDDTINRMEDALRRLKINDYDVYQYNDQTFIYLINSIVDKDSFNQIKTNYEDLYLILLTAPTDFNKQMNLQKICDYLYNNQPSKFNYKEYVNWLNSFNEVITKYTNKYSSRDFSFEIVNSYNQEVLAKLVDLPIKVINRDAHFRVYNDISFQILKSCLKFENQKIMVNMSSKVMAQRKTLEAVKKIINNNNILWINVLDNKEMGSNEFLKLISKYKCLNLHLSCDSSVFLNIELMFVLPLFDAIYFQYEEYESIRLNDVGMPQAIMSYAINQQMLVLIENFKPNYNLDYQHASCYYIVPIK